MNKVNVTMTAAIVSSLFATGFASADFQGISIDEVEGGFGVGTTYRVYVDVETGDQLNAVFGDTVDPLLVSSTTGFYQNQFGSYKPPSAALFGFFPSLEYDSFVTIGLLTDAGNSMLDIGIDWGVFEGGADIETSNGSWFATPADAQVFEVGGRVLIGQFTTTGEISGFINIQGKNADLTNWQYRSVPLPAPGAIALLGLAGLVARRRRK
jgi:MYXO-CTERM domain-containing protein